MIVWPSQNSLMYAILFVAFASNLSVTKTMMNKTQPLTSRGFSDWLWTSLFPSKTPFKTGSLFKRPMNVTGNKSEKNNECPKLLGSRACHGYARRWIRFYVKIGGWIMLAVISCGIFILILTHILSKKSMKNSRNECRQRVSLVEATERKKFINA